MSTGPSGDLKSSTSGVRPADHRHAFAEHPWSADWKSSPSGTSSSAAPVLAGAALLLVPLDMALVRYGERGGTLSAWVPWARLVVPVCVLAGLLLSGRVTRRDVGLAVGRPRAARFWFAVSAAFFGAVYLVIGVLGFFAVRLGWSEPQEWFGPFILVQEEDLGRTLWETCLLVPLYEEPLYRGILVPALEGVGGRRLAVLGSGVVWTSLHWLYGWDVFTLPFHFLYGAAAAWLFLKSRSLLVLMALHALILLAGALFDLVLLKYPDLLLWPQRAW
jgi:membrane protease YdiL (CAAX protease family)